MAEITRVHSDDPNQGDPQAPNAPNDEPLPVEEGIDSSGRPETQPIFLQEYWRGVGEPEPLPQVPAEETGGFEARPSTADLPALDGLLDFESEEGRDPSMSAIKSLSEFEAAFPSLPEGMIRLPDSGPDQDNDAKGDDDDGDGDGDGVGVGVGVGEEEDDETVPIPVTSGDDGERAASGNPAEVEDTGTFNPLGVKTTEAGNLNRLTEEASVDGLGELDAKSTHRFTGPLFSDEGATNLWEFAEKGIEGAGDGDGQIIADRYVTVGDLGAGGMARIIKVRHLNLGKEFALKIIHDDLSSDYQMRKIFIREARVASLMNHPSIVAVTDFGVDPNLGAYIVMEYLKGETLHDRLEREGRLRLPLAMDIGLQVAEALHYMHQQNIIHCDIKPENIFLSQPPKEMRRGAVVKLIDFGLSRREAMGAQLASSEVGGTPDFMAPEQIKGLAPQPSMDIYALGMLLYEMIAGEAAFMGSLEEVIAAQLNKPPDPPSTRMDEPLDESVDQLLLKALMKRPEDRQPSMGQVIFELRTVMDMLGIRSSRRRRAAVDRSHGREAGEGAKSEPRRDEAAMVFDHCPCPLFRIDTEPKILVANEAFCQFLGIPTVGEAVGMPLDETRLGHLYPTLRMEVLDAAMNKVALQRMLSFEKEGVRAVQVMLWLVPELDEAAGQTTFAGIITPIS